jgi:ankyrin repeat protein
MKLRISILLLICFFMGCKQKENVPLAERADSSNEQTAQTDFKEVIVEIKEECGRLNVAIADNDIDKVKQLLAQNEDPNRILNTDCIMPIELASKMQNYQIVKLLLKHGAKTNPRIFENQGDSALHNAVYRNDIKMAKLLLKHGANVNAYNFDYEEPIFAAVRNRNFEMIKLLLKYNSDINAETPSSFSPFDIALTNDDHEMAEFLLKNGVDVEKSRTKNFGSYLHYVKDVKMAKLLLKYGADVNNRNMYGYTPLDDAKNSEIMKLLIKNGGKRNPNPYKENPTVLFLETLENERQRPPVYPTKTIIKKQKCNDLNTAVLNGDIPAVKKLLNDKFDVNIISGDKCLAPLELAVVLQNHEMAKFLLENGAKPNPRPANPPKNSALHIAVKKNDIEMAKLLLEHGANAKAYNDFYLEPIFNAVENRNFEMIELLLKYNADINASAEGMYTPIALAIKDSELMEFLLEHGADPDLGDLDDGMALLCYVNDMKVAKLLIEHGANVNKQSMYSRTPLWCAVTDNKMELSKLLIANGADINPKKDKHSDRGPEPYALVAINYSTDVEILKLLLENKANPNAKYPVNVLAAIGSLIDSEILRPLLENNADPDTKYSISTNIKGNPNIEESPLTKAVEKSLYDHAKLLLEYGADPNIEIKLQMGDYDAKTVKFPSIVSLPLHIAVKKNDVKMAKLLLEYGADSNKKNGEGKTPLELAKTDEMRELLLSAQKRKK